MLTFIKWARREPDCKPQFESCETTNLLVECDLAWSHSRGPVRNAPFLSQRLLLKMYNSRPFTCSQEIDTDLRYLLISQFIGRNL